MWPLSDIDLLSWEDESDHNFKYTNFPARIFIVHVIENAKLFMPKAGSRTQHL